MTMTACTANRQLISPVHHPNPPFEATETGFVPNHCPPDI
jgi:hypothetical protein